MKLDALAFGAHPDDVELACSGTLLRLGSSGSKTGIVTLTKGEMGTRGTPEIRAREFEEAGRILGLSVQESLDIPDGRINVSWGNKLKVVKVIRTYTPRIVFAPYWVVRHPDHENTSHLVRESAYLAGLKKLDTGQSPFRPYKVIYYQSRFEFNPTFIVDISDFHEQKKKAIRAYHSQFSFQDALSSRDDGTQLGRPDFLEWVGARDRRYGAAIGVKFGEPFFVREAIRINDPVDFFGPECLETMP